MKKLQRFLLSPTAFMLVLLALQLALARALLSRIDLEYAVVYQVLTGISLVLGAVLFAADSATGPTYKLLWLWIFIALPLTGELMYFVWGRPGLFKKKEARFLQADRLADQALDYDQTPLRQLEQLDAGLACQARYLLHEHNPLYSGTQARYFGRGCELYPVLLEELERASVSIWMEYFLIGDDGECWHTILEILKRKAAAGVDVRLIFDSVGSLFTLEPHTARTLQKLGIRCLEFNPVRFTPHISDYGFLNHRDHRKLCIIDGQTGFTGGVNLSDEYFDKAQPFGRWKDASIQLKGPGVYSFVCTFLKMWNALTGDETPCGEYRRALPLPTPDDLLVQPFDDMPLDTEQVSQNAYSNMLRHAHSYVWITTPYLIPDHQLIESLCLTAKSGVEVRIITPGIPDKKTVFLVTRSYYKQLMASGVRIYEYSPGFIHSKLYLCDDKVAIVGSANMDYRSLFLHFENCCALYGGCIIGDIRADLEKTVAECREVTLADVNYPFFTRLAQLVLRFFGPLL